VYQITDNQREQNLLKILTALEHENKNGNKSIRDNGFLFRTYQKIQSLPIGGSLLPEESSRLKKILKQRQTKPKKKQTQPKNHKRHRSKKANKKAWLSLL
jgi:hypothetical protein